MSYDQILEQSAQECDTFGYPGEGAGQNASPQILSVSCLELKLKPIPTLAAFLTASFIKVPTSNALNTGLTIDMIEANVCLNIFQPMVHSNRTRTLV